MAKSTTPAFDAVAGSTLTPEAQAALDKATGKAADTAPATAPETTDEAPKAEAQSAAPVAAPQAPAPTENSKVSSPSVPSVGNPKGPTVKKVNGLNVKTF